LGTTRKQTSRNKRNATVPKECEFPGCGYDIIVTKHRITPGAEKGKYILGNVIALCPNHHSEADRGLIEPVILRKIVAERIIREHGEIAELQSTGELTEAVGRDLTEALGPSHPGSNGISSNGVQSGTDESRCRISPEEGIRA
jgi:hypothetical protein